MFERLRSRQGVICLGFVLWSVTTFGHFLSAPQCLQNRPRPATARPMERIRSLLSEEGVEGDEEVDVEGDEEEDEEEDEEKDEEEDEEEDEAGRYQAWWQEQLERRVRVAQTCVRSTFSLKCFLIVHFL